MIFSVKTCHLGILHAFTKFLCQSQSRVAPISITLSDYPLLQHL